MEHIETVKIVLGGVVILYETLSRVVPTSKNWTIVGNVLKTLLTISNYLNIKKK